MFRTMKRLLNLLGLIPPQTFAAGVETFLH